MSAVSWLKRLWFIFPAFAALVVTLVSAANPRATERFYSTGLYPKLAGVAGRIFGAAPFSAAQWIVLFSIPLLIFYIACVLIRIIADKSRRRVNVTGFITAIFGAAGIIWLVFTVCCGLNYNRISFADSSGLDVRPSSVDELIRLCAGLASDAGIYADKMLRGADGSTVSSFPAYSETAACAVEAYGLIGKKYVVLSGFSPKPKPVIFSRAMSAAGIVGLYFPFTFEANVNIDVPDYLIPSSMLHELAHFKGFMREDEANFISYAACLASGNDEFIYSGLMLALTHSLNELYLADRGAYWQITGTLSGNVLADFNANNMYWKQFEGPVSDASEKINDVYLRANRQFDGVKSYGRMVDLLLAEQRQHNSRV